jgi:putative protease
MPRKKTGKKAVKKVEEVAKQAGEQIEEAVEDLGEEIGKITHYFSKIGVAVIELAKSLGAGEQIRVKGNTTDFKQKAGSMQVEHKPVEKAKKGQAIGLKVEEKVRPGDKVYRVEE